MKTNFKSSSTIIADVNNMGINYLRVKLDNDTGRYIEADTESKQGYVILNLFSSNRTLISSTEFEVVNNPDTKVATCSLDLINKRIIITNTDDTYIVCDISDLVDDIDKKVDEVPGKGLSTNDFTDELKNKLESLENYVLPDDVPRDPNYVHTDNNFTTEEKNKLASLSNYDDTQIKQDIQQLQETKLNAIKVNEQVITDANIKTDEESIIFENNVLKLPDGWINYLQEQTFAIPTITLTASQSTRTFEYGAIVTSNFSHRETNIDNISGTLTLKKNNAAIESNIEKTTSNVTLQHTLNEPITANISYVLTCVDTRGTTRNSNTITFSCYKPTFYGTHTDDTLTNISTLTKKASASLGTVSFNSQFGEYGYFVTAGTINSITSGGFAVPFVKQAGTINVTLNGKTVAYNVYRTAGALDSGSNTFVIA